MALTPERIRELWENYSPTQGIESFARSVEAEARAQDTALIQQLVEALEGAERDNHVEGVSAYRAPIIAAARARLQKESP